MANLNLKRMFDETEKTTDEAFRDYLNEWKDSIWMLAAAVCTDNEGFTHAY